MGEKAYLWAISGFLLFAWARSMSENIERSKKLYINVSASRSKFWILVFIETLKWKSNDF